MNRGQGVQQELEAKAAAEAKKAEEEAAAAAAAAAKGLKQSEGYGGPIAGAGAVAEAAGSSPRNPLITSRAPVSTFTAPGSIRAGLEGSPGLVRQSSGAPGSAGFVGGDPSNWQEGNIYPDPPSTYEQMMGSQTAYSGTPRTHQQDYMDQYIADARGRQGITLQSAAAGIAGGEVSDSIRHQHERARQSALSAEAGARGVPAGAAHRAKVQQLSEGDRAATEAAANQQMQAMQMVDEANKADAQINAQLEGQRDSMIGALIAQGVQRDVAIMQVDAQLEQQRRELGYKYWAGRLGASTEVVKAAIEATGFFSDEVSTVASMAPIINVLMGFGVPGGDTYGVPTQTLVGSREGEIGLQTRSGGEAPPKGYVKNETTGRWELQEGYSKPDPVIVTRTNAQGDPVEVMKIWDEDNGTWEYIFEMDADSKEWLAAKRQANDPSMRGQIRRAIAAENERRAANGEPPMTDAEIYALAGEITSSQGVRGPSDGRVKQNIEPTGVGGYNPAPSPFGTDKKDQLLGDLSLPEPPNKLSLPDQPKPSLGEFQLEKPIWPTTTSSIDWKGIANTGLKSTSELLGAGAAVAPLLGARGRKEKDAALAKAGFYGLGKAIEGGMSLTETDPSDLKDAVAKGTEDIVSSLGMSSDTSADVITDAADAATDTAKAVVDAGTEAVTDVAEDTASSAIPGVGTGFKLASKLLTGEDPGTALAQTAGSTAGAAALSWIPGVGAPIGSILGGLGGKALSGLFGGTNLSNYDPDAPLRLDIGKDLTYKVPDPARFVNSGFETKSNVEKLHVPDTLSYSGPQTTLGGFGQQLQWDPSGTISDEEAKAGVGPSQDELSNFLRELNPVKYDYKPEFGGETDQYGIIAQDAEKTGPGKSFVSKDENGIRRIDSGKATMVGLAADANQQKLLDSQSMMIASLLKRLDRIEGKG